MFFTSYAMLYHLLCTPFISRGVLNYFALFPINICMRHSTSMQARLELAVPPVVLGLAFVIYNTMYISNASENL